MIGYRELTLIFSDEGFLDFAQLAKCYSDHRELYNLVVRGLAKKKVPSVRVSAWVAALSQEQGRPKVDTSLGISQRSIWSCASHIPGQHAKYSPKMKQLPFSSPLYVLGVL